MTATPKNLEEASKVRHAVLYLDCSVNTEGRGVQLHYRGVCCFVIVILVPSCHLPTFYLLIQTMIKKKLTDNSSPIESTHVGLLHKSVSVGISANWHSLGEESKKRQPNLFGCGSLKVVKEEAMP